MSAGMIRIARRCRRRPVRDPLAELRAVCAADVAEVVASFATRLAMDEIDQAAFRRIVDARFDRFWAACVAHADTIRAATTWQESAAIVERLNGPLWDDLDAEFTAYAERAGLGEAEGWGCEARRLD